MIGPYYLKDPIRNKIKKNIYITKNLLFKIT